MEQGIDCKYSCRSTWYDCLEADHCRGRFEQKKQSSTDYDVAFMQSFTFADLQMADVLVRWYDYRTKTMKYGFLEAPTYGMQVCMKIWKLTHGEHLKKLGFKEANCLQPESCVLPCRAGHCDHMSCG